MDIEDKSIDSDSLMEAALEAGAEDFSSDGDIFEIFTLSEDLDSVRDELENKGYVLASCDTDKIPSNYVELTDEEDIKKMNLLLEHLEENDDVVNVYHNWNADDE